MLPYLMVVLSYFPLSFEICYLGTQQKSYSWISKYDCQTRKVALCPEHGAVTCSLEWHHNHRPFLQTMQLSN